MVFLIYGHSTPFIVYWVMKVRDARVMAKEWIGQEAVKWAGFQGAVFHGSINWLSEDADIPASSDVDILVVLDNHPPQTSGKNPPPSLQGKSLYRNLLLEVSWIAAGEVQTPEQLLVRYPLAASFKSENILSDPTGRLTTIGRAITAKYTDPYWIEQRCRDASANVQRFMDQLDKAQPLHDQVTSWLFAKGALTHILLTAGLKNPTVRKRYVNTRQLLATYNALDLYERLLALSGFSQLSVQDVERHLTALTDVYDTAATFIRTPYRFAADISQAARPVVIDGSRELIDAGFHREAMFWIVATFCRCRHVLQQDASLEVRNLYEEAFTQLLVELNILTFTDRQLGNQQVRAILPEIEEMAQTIIRHITLR